MRLKLPLFLVCVMTGLFLSGCTGPGGLSVQLLSPVSGTVQPLGYEVGMYAVPNRPIIRLQYFVNGDLVHDETSGFHDYLWLPPAPGDYVFKVRAFTSNTVYADSIPADVCVMNFNFPGEQLVPGDFHGGLDGTWVPYNYTGPCELPQANPNPPSTLVIGMTSSARPSSLSYSYNCPNQFLVPSIDFRAQVNDPANLVAFVLVRYTVNLSPVPAGATLMLNPTGERTAAGERIYEAVTNILPDSSTDLRRWLYIASYYHGDTNIYWTARAVGASGQVLVSNGPYSISTSGTVCGTPEPLDFSTPTSMRPSLMILPPGGTNTPSVLNLVPTFTATPSKLIARVQAYPSPIYYGQDCPSLGSLSFSAALLLPSGAAPNQVQAFAHVGIADPGGSDAGHLLIPLSSNGTWDAASGGQNFLGSLSLAHSYQDANNQFDPASLGGSSGSLQWYITVSSAQGTELARSAQQSINLAPCPTQAKPSSVPSSGGSCTLSQPVCSLKGLKFDPSTCSCVP